MCSSDLGGEVGRTDHALGVGEVRDDLAPPPGVVAEREHVGAGCEQPLGEARGDAGPVGDVLRVDDAEADPELFLQRRQPFLDRRPPGRAEDVRDEEDLQE